MRFAVWFKLEKGGARSRLLLTTEHVSLAWKPTLEDVSGAKQFG